MLYTSHISHYADVAGCSSHWIHHYLLMIYIYIYIYIYISFLYIYFIFNLNIFFIYALTPTPILIYLQFMHWQLGPCSKYFLAPSLILPIIFYYYEPFAYDVGDVFYTKSVSPKLNHIKFLFYVYFIISLCLI
jgi:hypothetical protein